MRVIYVRVLEVLYTVRFVALVKVLQGRALIMSSHLNHGGVRGFLLSFCSTSKGLTLPGVVNEQYPRCFPRLAYGSLHEASTALLPSGCPLCRRHLLLCRRLARAESNGRSDAAAVPLAAPLPHCDICALSARVVMRGVGLMERDRDYNNAFHYLEILLQVRKTAVYCCTYFTSILRPSMRCHRCCTWLSPAHPFSARAT